MRFLRTLAPAKVEVHVDGRLHVVTDLIPRAGEVLRVECDTATDAVSWAITTSRGKP